MDGWWLGGGVMGMALKAGGYQAATDVDDPKTVEKRRAAAGRCEAAL